MSTQINPTDTERLLLANQYEILSKVDPTGEAERYARVASALRSGHKYLYENFLNETLEPVLSDEDTRLVLDILALHRGLQRSWEQLTDKAGVEKSDVAFGGFDGNNETELYYFARALAKDSLYPELLGDGDLNSHSTTRGRYGRMLQAFADLGKPQFPYDKATILKIIGKT